MKGILCYFSSTGNTRLACQYIAANIKTVDIKLFDIANEGVPDLSEYDIVGFATPTEHHGPPQLIQSLFENIKVPDRKRYAFAFNTYGGQSGKTLLILRDWCVAKGFKTIGAYSLKTPDNDPRFRSQGYFNEEDPDENTFDEFRKFISSLDKDLQRVQNGEELENISVKLDEQDLTIPYAIRTAARDHMGMKYVDKALCSICGLCQKLCPYKAIELDPAPSFNMSKCYGCWTCFNRCPSKAIYTNKVRDAGHYPYPGESYRKKFELCEQE